VSLAYLKLSLGSRVWKLIDTPYRAMWDTPYWGFLGVRTTFDIFQNLRTDTPYLLDGYEKMPPKKRTTTTTTTTTPMTDAQLKALITQGVAGALAKRDADRSRNGDDGHDSGSDRRRRMPVARECTYSDFLKFQPLNFKCTEGVVGLTQWFEKIESVFHISNCTVTCQIKFYTCTL
ncbi:hypothetical protein Tco_1059785, partial [Tanacetum coccineum]